MATILYGGFVLPQQKAYAAGTNSTINFQARLQMVAGNVAPDGKYNVQFKLYNATSGGTALWTETYYDSNGVTAGNDNRVNVSNGYLSVNLGSQTAFSGINWDQELYLTMNIGGTTQTATPTYDGEMDPRLRLTGVPYAFRAGQLAQYNATTTYTSTLSLQSPTGGNQDFVIQDQGAGGTYNLLTTNTADANYIKLQASTPGTAQTGYFNISGTGIAGILQAGTFDGASSGALAIGSTNATSINIGKTGSNILTTINGTGLFKPTSGNDSVTALQVQPAGSTTPVLDVDTTNVRIGIGTATPTQQLHIYVSNGAAPVTVKIQNAAGTTGTESRLLLSTTTTYNNETTGAAVTAHRTGGAGNGSTDLYLQTSNTGSTLNTQATISSTGVVTFKNSADATGAFQVQPAGSATPVFNVDTSNSRVGIGLALPLYKLDVVGDVNTSTVYRVGGTSGATTTCTSGNVLQNAVIAGGIVTGGSCIANGAGVTLQNVYDNSASPATIALSSTNLGFKIKDASTTVGGDLFSVQNNAGSTKYLNVTTSGASVAGTLSASGGFVGSSLDLSSSGTLTIGGTNATTLSLGNGTSNTTLNIGGANTGYNSILGLTIALNSGSGSSGTVTSYAGASTFTVENAGLLLAQTTNSSSAFTLQNSSSNTIFNVDTSSNIVTVKTSNTNSNTALKVVNSSNVTVFNVSTNTNPGATITTNSTAALLVQDTSNAALLTVDTSNVQVIVGSVTNGLLFSGSSGYTLYGNARSAKRIMLTPEYAGAALDPGSGSNNTGSMTSGYDGTNRTNYYKWTTAQGTNQSYDVVVQVPVPNDFSAWSGSTPLCINAYTSNTTNGTITGQVIKSDTFTDSNYSSFHSFTPGSTSTWTPSCYNLESSGYNAGDYLTVRIRMQSPNGGDVRIGNVYMDYLSNK